MKNSMFYILFLIFFLIFASCKENEPCNCEPIKLKVGVLLPLSGSGSSSGEGMYAGLMVAKDEIDVYLHVLGGDKQLNLVVYDTKTDTTEALKRLKELYEQGIRIVIGPYSSAEVHTIKSFADSNGILILSPSSVAISLAIAGDNIFRFSPSDFSQAKAITRYFINDSTKFVIPISRDDVWGFDLVKALYEQYSVYGGIMNAGIRYNPSNTDFSNVLKSLDEQVQIALSMYDTNEISIFLASFNEGNDILAIADNYPYLKLVKWTGSSAFALNKNLVTLNANKNAAEFAYNHKFLCPIFGFDEQALSIAYEITKKVKERIKREPDIYALTSYDALWVAIQTYLATGTDKYIEELKKNLVIQAAKYFGATGNTKLDVAGDRVSGNYDFWGMQYNDTSDTYSWKKYATYLVNQDKIIKY